MRVHHRDKRRRRGHTVVAASKANRLKAMALQPAVLPCMHSRTITGLAIGTLTHYMDPYKIKKMNVNKQMKLHELK